MNFPDLSGINRAMSAAIQIPVNPAIRAAEMQSEVMTNLLSAESMFSSLEDAIEELCSLAPEDHDVLIEAFGIAVEQVKLVKPHTLVFSGTDNSGHRTFVVAHFSQVVARVVYLPKKTPSRVVTGFSVDSDE
jgi:hypothetical protein